MPKSRIIPFVTSAPGLKIAEKYYPDRSIIRCNLSDAISRKSCGNHEVWLDTDFESVYKPWILGKQSTSYTRESIRQSINIDEICKIPVGNKKQLRTLLAPHIVNLLDKCNGFNPTWISIPQLPLDVSNLKITNKINSVLAELTLKWTLDNPQYMGKLILPVILRKNWPYSNNTEITRILKPIQRLVMETNPWAVWLLDQSFDENNPTKQLQKKLANLLRLHEELRNANWMDSIHLIGGPYWAANLILLAKGFIDFSFIKTRVTQKYYLQGGFIPQSSKERILIKQLFMLINIDNKENIDRNDFTYDDFRSWIEQAKQCDTISLPLRNELNEIYKRFGAKTEKKEKPLASKPSDIAEYFANLYTSMLENKPNVRPLWLFQQFSRAYMDIKMIEQMPNNDIEKIIDALMNNCL